MKSRLFLPLLIASLGCINADIINGDTDAVGVPRDLSLNTIFAGYDASQTTSIRKHILTHLSSDNLRTFTSTSLLYLQNSSLELDATYTFTHGAIKIVGKVEILGSGHKFRFASHSLSIAEGSELVIGDGVEFEFAPTSSLTTAVRFDSDSSKLTLRSSTLTVSNDLGMHLIGGNLCIEGDSIIDNAFTTTTKALFLGTNITGTNATGDGDCNLQIKSGAKLTVKNAGVVFQNNGAGSFDGAEGEGSLVVEDSANFLFDSTAAFNNGGATLNFSEFNGLNIERISGINSTPVADLGTIAVIIFAVEFSPDGKFIAVGSFSGGTHGEIAVFSFDGSSLVKVAEDQKAVADGFSVSWSPDGKFLAAGFDFTSGEGGLEVFSFDGSSLVSVDEVLVSNTTFNMVSFSPDGRFIAAGSESGGANEEVEVYSFNGSTLTSVAQVAQNVDVFAVSWSPDGKFLAVASDTAGADEEIAVYRFDGSSLTKVAEIAQNVRVFSVDFSPDGKFLVVGSNTAGADEEVAVYRFDGSSLTKVTEIVKTVIGRSIKFSPDGKFLVVGSGATGGTDEEIAVYSFDGNSLTKVAEIVYDLIVYSVDFSPDGKFVVVGPAGGTAQVAVFELNYSQGRKLVELENSTIKLGKDMKLQDIQLTPR